jgi:hypothetical protein
MFNLYRGQVRDCECISRREILRIGGLGLAGLSLPGLLRLESQAEASATGHREQRSVILMWMQGGPSHIDTFDPKPNAPAEIRGEFGVIPTVLPGVQISEHLPHLARNLDKFSIIRSGYSYNAGHGIADAYMLSGWRWTPTTVFPSYGSVVAKELGYRRGMPPYVQLGTSVDQKSGGGLAGYLGNEHNPFVVSENPNGAKFNIDGISLPGDMNVARFSRRRRMLGKFDRWQERVEAQVSDVGAMDSFYEKAFGIVTSPQAKKAFDLAKEDPRLRDSYGRNSFGQSCLLARRLVEAGVRFVTVSFGGWDTHAQNFTSLKNHLLPTLDLAYATLLRDLQARGLLDNTIVVWMGDFGRTPKINSAAGRDHWAGSTVFGIGGGGIKTGQVFGQSDQYAEQPVGSMVQAEDIAVTLYSQLGIPLDTVYTAPDGRPYRLNVGGRVLDELIV